MARLAPVVAPLLVLASPLIAWAHSVPGFGRGSMSFYYAAPVPLVPGGCYPCPIYVLPPCPPVTPAPPPAPGYVPPMPPSAQPGTNFAKPTAAPPSSGPPAQSPRAAPSLPSPGAGAGPAVSESRSYYDAYAVVVKDAPKPAGSRCSIEFWNLTDRNLTLKVDGQARSLERGKSMLLEVGRHFVWQIEGHEVNKENIAMGESALEIVIRR